MLASKFVLVYFPHLYSSCFVDVEDIYILPYNVLISPLELEDPDGNSLICLRIEKSY